jgi:hypothetical protein
MHRSLSPRSISMRARCSAVKNSGPYDPRPLSVLEHHVLDDSHKWWAGKAKAGYSLAEAAAFLEGPETEWSARLERLVSSFALWGRRGQESLYRAINRHSVELRNVEKSELIDGDNGDIWFDVRFIPPIYAPNIHEFIDKYPFGEAFARVVHRDPETMAAFKIAADAASCLCEGRRYLELVYGDIHLAEMPWFSLNFAPRMIAAFEEFERKKVRLGTYPDLIGRKAQRLLQLLRAGLVQSDGFWRMETLERPFIPATVWGLPNLKLKILDGELVDDSGAREWCGIRLRAPELDVEETETPRLPQSSSPTNKAERIPVQILGKTQPERIASLLSQIYDERPDMHRQQLLAEVNNVDSLGGASMPSLERALRLLGWTQPS